ncbi:MAG: MotA/TolQ/ExbB proton channel family protein [Myxococcales bacterium]|nr:MotA/TolQ/ExbB proton channel family protein [Myxococcales bacterium]
MVEWFQKGGIMMWPLLFSSVLSLGIFFERLYSLRRSRILPAKFLDTIEDLIIHEKIPEAVATCNKDGSSIANIIQSGIRNFGARRELIKETIEEVGRREAVALGRYTEVTGTVAAIAPLMGLLGTVLGMIKVFDAISVHGVGNPAVLSTGISEALITTVAGLVIAIPSLVAYRYLISKADRLVNEMEEISIKMADLMKGSD